MKIEPRLKIRCYPSDSIGSESLNRFERIKLSKITEYIPLGNTRPARGHQKLKFTRGNATFGQADLIFPIILVILANISVHQQPVINSPESSSFTLWNEFNTLKIRREANNLWRVIVIEAYIYIKLLIPELALVNFY